MKIASTKESEKENIRCNWNSIRNERIKSSVIKFNKRKNNNKIGGDNGDDVDWPTNRLKKEESQKKERKKERKKKTILWVVSMEK